MRRLLTALLCLALLCLFPQGGRHRRRLCRRHRPLQRPVHCRRQWPRRYDRYRGYHPLPSPWSSWISPSAAAPTGPSPAWIRKPSKTRGRHIAAPHLGSLHLRQPYLCDQLYAAAGHFRDGNRPAVFAGADCAGLGLSHHGSGLFRDHARRFYRNAALQRAATTATWWRITCSCSPTAPPFPGQFTEPLRDHDSLQVTLELPGRGYADLQSAHGHFQPGLPAFGGAAGGALPAVLGQDAP